MAARNTVNTLAVQFADRGTLITSGTSGAAVTATLTRGATVIFTDQALAWDVTWNFNDPTVTQNGAWTYDMTAANLVNAGDDYLVVATLKISAVIKATVEQTFPVQVEDGK